MLIEILNWSRPRSDVNSTSWFKMANNFWRDPVIGPLDNDGKVLWTYLLASASEALDNVIVMDEQLVDKLIVSNRNKVISILEKLQDGGKIRIRKRRPRNVSVASEKRREEKRREESPLSPPLQGERENLKPRSKNPSLRRQRQEAHDKAVAIATVAIGAVRSGQEEMWAMHQCSRKEWRTLMGKFGSWESFVKAYAVSTHQKQSGGNSATVFESQLIASLTIGLLRQAGEESGDAPYDGGMAPVIDLNGWDNVQGS